MASSRAKDRKAITHHWSLEQKVDHLIKAARTGTCTTEDLAKQAIALKVDIKGVGKFLSDHIQHIAYNEIRGEGSDIASRVFAIPELAENILFFLSNKQLWEMFVVCRGFRDIIDASHKLQVKLWLRPGDPKDKVQTLKYNKYGDQNPNGGRFEAMRLSRRAAEPRIFCTIRPCDLLRGIGSRRAKTLICQPPVKRLRMWIVDTVDDSDSDSASGNSDDSDDSDDSDNTPLVHREGYVQDFVSDTGITIGQLQEAAVQHLDGLSDKEKEQVCHYFIVSPRGRIK